MRGPVVTNRNLTTPHPFHCSSPFLGPCTSPKPKLLLEAGSEDRGRCPKSSHSPSSVLGLVFAHHQTLNSNRIILSPLHRCIGTLVFCFNSSSSFFLEYRRSSLPIHYIAQTHSLLFARPPFSYQNGDFSPANDHSPQLSCWF